MLVTFAPIFNDISKLPCKQYNNNKDNTIISPKELNKLN